MNLPFPNIPHALRAKLNSIRLISIWGDFGVGKTTLALQAAFNHYKEKKGNILYFYTKPDFPMGKLQRGLNTIGENLREAFMESIAIIKLDDFESLKNRIMNFELVIKRSKSQKNHISLIVLDSITDLYQLELTREKKEKNASTNYLLNLILGTLFYLSDAYGVDIIIVNELVRRKKGQEILEVQSGWRVTNYWTHQSIKLERTSNLNTRRVIFYGKNGETFAELVLYLTDKGFCSKR